ncbi:MAG: sialidase family protein, partial [Candidatus Thermoplasmatota archaeon]
MLLIISVFLAAFIGPGAVSADEDRRLKDQQPDSEISESYPNKSGISPSVNAEEANWTEAESVPTGDSVNTDHLLEGGNGDLYWSFGSRANFASVYRSTEGGDNWAEVKSVETNDDVVTDYLLEDDGGNIFWAFGDRDGSAHLYRSTDGGGNWSEVKRSDGNDQVLTNHLLEAKDGNLYWSFGDKNSQAHIYRSNNSGANWTEVKSVETQGQVNTDHLLEDEGGNISWSFGDDDSYAYLYRSTNDGENWSEAESIDAGSRVNTDHLLEDKDGNLYWSFGSDDNRAFLYRSTDMGRTWNNVEEINTQAGVKTDHLLEDEEGNIFWSFGANVNGDRGAFLYRSTDGGENWIEEQVIWVWNGINTDHLLEDEEGNIFWSLGNDGDNAFLYRSVDGGKNWANIQFVGAGDEVLTDHLLSTESGDLYWSFGARANDGHAYLYYRKFSAVPNEMEVSPLETTIKAGETQTYDVTVYDQIGNVMDIGPENLDWDIDNDAGGGWTDNKYTSETAGSWIVTANLTYEGEKLSKKAFLHVEPGEVDEVNIQPEEDQAVQAGEKLVFAAEALDGPGNSITKDVADFEWGNAVNGVFSKTEPGEYDVTATYEGVNSSTVTVTVEPAAPSSLEIEPKKRTVTAGENIAYTASTYDEFNNEIEDVTEETNWSIEEGAGGEWDNHVYTSEAAGEWTVEGDHDGVTGTVDLVVEPGEVDSVSIMPEEGATVEKTVRAGEELFFRAEARDAEGNLITRDVAEFEWKNAVNGVFSKTEPGEYDVTAAYDGVTSSPTSVVVEPADPYYLDIEPGEEIVSAGGTVTYNAVSCDEFGNEIEEVTEETNWSIDEEAGGVWEENAYHSENAGEWTVTGTHTLNGEEITGEAALQVLSPDMVWVDITTPKTEQVFAERNVTVEWQSENAEAHEIRLDEEEWIDVGMET